MTKVAALFVINITALGFFCHLTLLLSVIVSISAMIWHYGSQLFCHCFVATDHCILLCLLCDLT